MNPQRLKRGYCKRNELTKHIQAFEEHTQFPITQRPREDVEISTCPKKQFQASVQPESDVEVD